MKNNVGVGVGVMIFKDGKILLGKRHQDPEKADSELHGENTWTMPGGKLEYNETIEECALREVEEETGIKLKKFKVICVNNDKNEHAHFITIGVFADDFDGEASVKEPDEITEWKWFSLDDVPNKMFFPSEKILRNYKKGEFYLKE